MVEACGVGGDLRFWGDTHGPLSSFCGLYLESYKVFPKRSYLGAYGERLQSGSARTGEVQGPRLHCKELTDSSSEGL